MKSSGQRIKEEREAKNWSQQRLADEITKIKKKRITRAAVAQWENGDSKTQKPENLFAAADALGLSPQWVQFGIGDKYSGSAQNSSSAEAQPRRKIINKGEIETATAGLTQEQQHILSVMENINPEARKALLQAVSLLSKSNQSPVTELTKPQQGHGVKVESRPVELEYIETETYKGPDRRHQDSGHTPERRGRRFGPTGKMVKDKSKTGQKKD